MLYLNRFGDRVSGIENIEKDVKQVVNQHKKVKSDKVYFEQKRSTGSYMIYKPSYEVIKLIREEE